MVAAALTFPALADANIEPGNIAAPWTNPYPTQPNVTYRGALPPDSGSYHALDYLKFTVTSAGETIEFTDQNATTGIDPNGCYHYCRLFLSLIDQNQTGLGDGAGTFATYGDTEVVDWTFPSAGTYYVVMESDGDVPYSYAVSYTIVSGGGPEPCNCGPPPIASLIRKLHVSPTQRGASVKVDVTPGQSVRSVRVALLHGKHSIVTQMRGPLGVARHRFTLHLPAAYRHKLKARHKLKLLVQITARGKNGASLTYYRPVTLT